MGIVQKDFRYIYLIIDDNKGIELKGFLLKEIFRFKEKVIYEFVFV